MNGLLEILTTRKWMISPEFVHSIREVVERNMNGHAYPWLRVLSLWDTSQLLVVMVLLSMQLMKKVFVLGILRI